MTRPFVRAFLPMWLVLGATMLVAQHTAAPKPTTGRAETPSQFYLRYRSAVQSASNLDDVTRFWQKSLVAEFKQAPADQRADLPAFKRMYGMLSDVSVVSVSIAPGGSTATIKLSGKTADGTTISGTAFVVREDGGWKLGAPEDWQEQNRQ